MSAAAAAILRDVYGPNAAKKIAREFDIAIVTAKLWLAGRFPHARTCELKAAVDTELARIERRNTEIRQHLGLGGRRGVGTQDGKASGGAAVGMVREDSAEAVGFRRPVRGEEVASPAGKRR